MFGTPDDYRRYSRNLRAEPLELQREMLRHLARNDLFYLLWFVCGRADMGRPWLLERCREVQAAPDGHLDLWAREHYKSSIITFGKTIQDILLNPEITVGIFSHNRPIAKGFLRQIKREFEQNKLMLWLFPEILWENPRRDAPKWSEDDGLIVQRTGNPKESTVEAHGLVDGQPIGKHYTHMVYDDVVTPDSVTTPDMIRKTTDAWAMSTNLSIAGGVKRYIGTRYHFNDTYREIISRQTAAPRIHAATIDGTPEGEPVLLSRDDLVRRRRDQGGYIFASQMLMNPKADDAQAFKKEWLRFHNGSEGEGCNRYILCDPAGEKKRESDFTVFWVLGLGADSNYYALDVVRDRLNLTERCATLFRLHRKWRPLGVGYEKYGKDSDIEHIQSEMNKTNYHFDIIPLGGQVKKPDRIRKLIPVFERAGMYLPQSRFYTQYDGRTIDLVEAFIAEEYDAFPVSVHDDMLDAMARIIDPEMCAIFPMQEDEEKPQRYSRRKHGGTGWSA